MSPTLLEWARCAGQHGVYACVVPRGGLVHVDRQFTRITGHDLPPAGVRRGLDHWVHEDDLHRLGHHRALLARTSDGEVLDIDLRLHRADGRWIRCACREVVADRDAAGGARRLVGTVLDLTEACRMGEPQCLGRRLETLDRRARALAHDLNNYLTVVMGHCDWIEASLGDERAVRESLEQLRSLSGRAADMTQGLLTLGRSPSEQVAVLELDQAVLDLTGALRALLDQRVDLRLCTGTPGSRVRINAVELDQILMNLVINARDAMPAGGTIHVETRALEGRTTAVGFAAPLPGPHVLLTVRDDGLGMDDATRARVFEAHFTTKDAGAGTGQGLSTVQRIVERRGGRVRVESALGRGSTFEVVLPRVTAAGQE